MDINNQYQYWNEVAERKTFTHPLDTAILDAYLNKQSTMLDFGCGYGRIVHELLSLGYENITGYDTSVELIKRGKLVTDLPLFHLNNALKLPVQNDSVDCILLFAVLTCIPSNAGQTALINLLHSKLKQGGILYISDYYLQPYSDEVDRYQYLDDDPANYGVFNLPEGVTFRHHTKDWITELTKHFTVLNEKRLEVMTMNGHPANAFQLVCKK